MHAKKRMRIKLKNPGRMLLILLVTIGLIVLGVKGIPMLLNSDPTQSEIEKLEGKDVNIISSQLVASVPNGDILTEQVIDFSVSYNYSLPDGSIKQYTQKSGIKIEVSDTALASIINNSNSIQIANGNVGDKELKVTVTYKKLTQVFNYTIKVPQTDTQQ